MANHTMGRSNGGALPSAALTSCLTACRYFLKAIEWARKYGLRINLDFHAVPGSQNGWNHSGKLGKVGFLNGPMGYANAQRALDQIRVLAEFISQPQYRDVIPFFGIMNEIQGGTVGKDQVKGFYLEAYKIVRNAGGGTGEGKGPWVSFHDAFFGRDEWSGFLAGGDRMSLDSHPYLAFGGQSDAPMSEQTTRPCDWGSQVNGTMANFGLANAGEWSNAVTDCGLWLTDVNDGTRYEGNYSKESTTRIGSCEELVDWRSWTDDYKNAVKEFSLSSMDALQVSCGLVECAARTHCISRTGSSGHGRLATRRSTATCVRHIGHTLLGWTTDGCQRTRAKLSENVGTLRHSRARFSHGKQEVKALELLPLRQPTMLGRQRQYPAVVHLRIFLRTPTQDQYRHLPRTRPSQPRRHRPRWISGMGGTMRMTRMAMLPKLTAAHTLTHG